MLDAIRSFFERELQPAAAGEPDDAAARARGPDPIALAACALLLELAHADDEFSAQEQRHIEQALARHFAMEGDAVHQLLELAAQERRRSADLYQFTRLIADRYDLGQKMVLAEVMWGVVYADGKIAQHEAYLMRKLSSLLGLKPGYLAEARKRVTEDTE